MSPVRNRKSTPVTATVKRISYPCQEDISIIPTPLVTESRSSNNKRHTKTIYVQESQRRVEVKSVYCLLKDSFVTKSDKSRRGGMKRRT